MTNPDELERMARAAIAVCKDDEMDWYMREHFPQLEPEDAAFIAAANPATILALLSANREMLTSLDEMLVIAALYLSSGDKTARRLKDAEFGSAMARARSALLTTQVREGK